MNSRLRQQGLISQRDVVSGMPFPPPAQKLLQTVRSHCHYSSPFWLPSQFMTTPAGQTFSLRQDDQLATAQVWLPYMFFSGVDSETASKVGDLISKHYRRRDYRTMNSSVFSAFDRSRILPIANAVFIEESDLLLFLVVHPIPMQFLTQLAAGARHHLIYLNGCWECCLSGSLGASWLSQATPSINAQLEHGKVIQGTRIRESQKCPTDSCFTDYLGYLMDPSPYAGGRRPTLRSDRVWLDAGTVEEFHLAMFRDAFWVPFHRMMGVKECHLYPDSGQDCSDCCATLLQGRYYVNTDCFELSRELSDLMEAAEVDAI